VISGDSMPTKLALEIFDAFASICSPIVGELDRPDTAIEWPGKPRPLWPRADISGHLQTGERFIVEVDDHSDPARSLGKYWPLIHATHVGEYEHPPIEYFCMSSRDATFGTGFEDLARFMGQRFMCLYPSTFRFAITELRGKTADALAGELLRYLSEGRIASN